MHRTWWLASLLLLVAGLAYSQAEYAGSAMCALCHEDVATAFESNPHSVLNNNPRLGLAEGQACESCHGPGTAHMESISPEAIRNPAKLPPIQADAVCLQCHLNQPTHVGRIQGGHAQNQVSCVSCHSVHAAQPPLTGGAHENTRINEQCASCHTGVWAAFQRPHAHKLPEGAMSCVDCHNPHGSFLTPNLQTVAANEPGCLGCHGDKRGPFVFEHAPVRLEGCETCHEPHGSANPRMLVRNEVSSLCLECHSNLYVNADGGTNSGVPGTVPPAFHDLVGTRYRACTTCHAKIHGSQSSREFLR